MFADFPMDSYLVKLEATNALSKTGKNVFKDDPCWVVYNDRTFGKNKLVAHNLLTKSFVTDNLE